MRLDRLLVQKGLALSRSHAQQLISAKQVFRLQASQKILLKKSSHDLPEDSELKVEAGPANRFVSRGGLKLEGALTKAALNPAGLAALDIGTSTGGFADCLLKADAKSVLGIDVGHDQINAQILKDPRFHLMEGVNARALSAHVEFQSLVPKTKFDLIVMDVSFISITLILPELPSLLHPKGFLLSLVKPQFEVGAEGLGKGGIVKDESLYLEVEAKVKAVCLSSGFVVKDYFESSIEGKEGNREFFVLCQKLS
jgi:23S rRNA (cytidine1920-2'-O)/16S rRNA (cytidine1409-2'-O)-methyltransferase